MKIMTIMIFIRSDSALVSTVAGWLVGKVASAWMAPSAKCILLNELGNKIPDKSMDWSCKATSLNL